MEIKICPDIPFFERMSFRQPFGLMQEVKYYQRKKNLAYEYSEGIQNLLNLMLSTEQMLVLNTCNC